MQRGSYWWLPSNAPSKNLLSSVCTPNHRVGRKRSPATHIPLLWISLSLTLQFSPLPSAGNPCFTLGWLLASFRFRALLDKTKWEFWERRTFNKLPETLLVFILLPNITLSLSFSMQEWFLLLHMPILCSQLLTTGFMVPTLSHTVTT